MTKRENEIGMIIVIVIFMTTSTVVVLHFNHQAAVAVVVCSFSSSVKLFITFCRFVELPDKYFFLNKLIKDWMVNFL